MNKAISPKFKDYTQQYFSQNGEMDSSKRDDLIMACTPLIKYIAQRLVSRLPSHVSIDDLISCGIIGLIDAIDKFDYNKKVQFKTYAEFRIKGAMLDELRSLDWMPRSMRRKVTDLENTHQQLAKKLGRPATDEEVAEELSIGIEEYHKLLNETKSVSFIDIEVLRQKVSDPGCGSLLDSLTSGNRDPFTLISIAEIRDLVANAISKLPEKERLTVTLYYYEELTMKEIGQVMNYTESRISQMHSKAMLRLRSRVQKKLKAGTH